MAETTLNSSSLEVPFHIFDNNFQHRNNHIVKGKEERKEERGKEREGKKTY